MNDSDEKFGLGINKTWHSSFDIFFRLFLFTQFRERSKSGFALSGFFAFALATGQLGAAVMNSTFKDTVVVWPGAGDHLIPGRLGGNGLKQFLKFAFGIFQDGNDRKLAKRGEKLAENKFARGIKAAIEKNRAQQSLEGVSERGRSLASAVLCFAAAKNEVLAEPETPAMLGKRPAIHQLRPRFGERPFAKRGEFFVKRARENKLKDSIAEEFEALVGLDRDALLVSNRRVSEGELEQGSVVKAIA
jgi:hypothetical protein